MAGRRTGGMTAIGVLNIIFGTIGTLLSLLVVLGGGLLAAGGATMETEAAADMEGMGSMVAAGGGLLAIMGVVGVIACATLVVSGIGVLKLASWGRTLTIVCGAVIVVLNVLSLLGGFSLSAILSAAYGGLLVGLFMKPDWKVTFMTGSEPVPMDAASDSDFRAAA